MFQEPLFISLFYIDIQYIDRTSTILNVTIKNETIYSVNLACKVNHTKSGGNIVLVTHSKTNNLSVCQLIQT